VLRDLAASLQDAVRSQRKGEKKFFAVISSATWLEITALFLFPALAQHPARVGRGGEKSLLPGQMHLYAIALVDHENIGIPW
jgi:hypothetical protein